MEADVLSDLLRAVRLQGAVFYDYRLAAPWVAASPESSRALEVLMPHADHLMMFHVVVQGQCWTRYEGGEPLLLSEGDVIVYPRGDAHVMSSSRDSLVASEKDTESSLRLLERARASERLPLVFEVAGGKPVSVALACGFFGCDLRPFNPLVAALPRELHVRAATGGDSPLGMFLDLTLGESRSGRAGGHNMLARMSELMFAEVVRRYLESLPEDQSGWLAGLRDRQVGKALFLIHGDPARSWTIAELAEGVSLSRSAFGERFSRLVGMSPMQYLARWRMQLASQLLGSSSHTVASIAQQVGYDSEAAFSRAFRRATGIPPASWRRRRSTPAEPLTGPQRRPVPRGSGSASPGLPT